MADQGRTLSPFISDLCVALLRTSKGSDPALREQALVALAALTHEFGEGVACLWLDPSCAHGCSHCKLMVIFSHTFNVLSLSMSVFTPFTPLRAL